MAKLVKKTPFDKGYSDELRTQIDFGDYDNRDVINESDAEFKKRWQSEKPANRFKYKTPAEQAKAMLADPELQKFTHRLYGGIVPGFEGDPTAGMTRDDYIEYLQNEKGWERDAALRHADLFFGKK